MDSEQGIGIYNSNNANGRDMDKSALDRAKNILNNENEERYETQPKSLTGTILQGTKKVNSQLIDVLESIDRARATAREKNVKLFGVFPNPPTDNAGVLKESPNKDEPADFCESYKREIDNTAGIISNINRALSDLHSELETYRDMV